MKTSNVIEMLACIVALGVAIAQNACWHDGQTVFVDRVVVRHEPAPCLTSKQAPPPAPAPPNCALVTWEECLEVENAERAKFATELELWIHRFVWPRCTREP